MIISVQTAVAAAGRQNFGIHRDKAASTKNGTTLRRIKRNRRERIAFGAIDRNFYFLLDARFLRGDHGFDSFRFSLFARLASFRRILKTFIAKKHLFADSPDEIL